MASDAKLVQRLLHGDHKQFKDTPRRSARARETITRTRPWECGKIGNIETQIFRVMICKDRLYTTGELARVIYANPGWDQNFRLRRDEKPPKLKSWHYLAIRKAAPAFADCVGRSTAKGRPWLWKLRRDEYFYQVRRDKRGTKQSAKSLASRR